MSDYPSTSEKAMTELSLRNLNDKELQELVSFAKSVKHGKSDAAFLSNVASCKDGYFDLRNTSQYGKWPKKFIENGWLVEHPTNKGWYTIKND